MNIVLCHIIGFIGGFVLDLIIGDPHEMPHVIRLIGNLISFVERKVYRDKRFNGLLLVVAVITVVSVISSTVLFCLYRYFYVAGIIFESVITFYCLATKSLVDESKKVAKDLETFGISKARTSLSMIVGRDTNNLDEASVMRATVETIAENSSDGVIAPMIYLCIGGPVLGLIYKSVNTMDSMVGYKNEKYKNFGFFAARLDDVFNFIPSRIAALISIIASGMCGYNIKNAFKIWRRDRRNHKSPNSAQTEAVYAGALGLRLAGGAYYFGKWVEKPYIGDEIKKIEVSDIYKAHNILYTSSVICMIMCLCPMVLFIVLNSF